MDNATRRELMVALYDLIAHNTEYKPRDTLDSIIAEHIEDYCVDTPYYNDYTDDNTCIIFTTNTPDNKRYKLMLIEMEN